MFRTVLTRALEQMAWRLSGHEVRSISGAAPPVHLDIGGLGDRRASGHGGDLYDR